MAAPPPRRSSFRLAVLGLSIAVSACCVAPPKAGDLLAVGFRTPEQAFHTFQTAVRADDLGSLRRCLSSRFIAEHRLSEQVFREFWDQLDKDEPYLRRGIADGVVEAPAEIRRDLARLQAVSHGRRIRVDLVREDFCEAWEGGDRRIDEAASFHDRSGVQTTPEGGRWIYGRMPVPDGVATEAITELRVGREWKIDGFEVLEQP